MTTNHLDLILLKLLIFTWACWACTYREVLAAAMDLARFADLNQRKKWRLASTNWRVVRHSLAESCGYFPSLSLSLVPFQTHCPVSPFRGLSPLPHVCHALAAQRPGILSLCSSSFLLCEVRMLFDFLFRASREPQNRKGHVCGFSAWSKALDRCVVTWEILCCSTVPSSLSFFQILCFYILFLLKPDTKSTYRGSC